MERGKGVRARRVGKGLGQGGRVRGQGGWTLYFNEIFNKRA